MSRYAPSAVLTGYGTVLAAGGITPTGATATAEIFEPGLGTWTPTGAMNTPRYQFTMVLLPNGQVLAAGGYNASGTALSSAEVYDPDLHIWQGVGSMASARARATAMVLSNGKVLVAGGTADGANGLASAELYDPTTRTWSSAGTFTGGGRIDAASAMLPNGSVMVAGGVSAGATSQSTTTIYTPDSGWRAGPSMPFTRTNFSLTPLPGGQLMASGGNTAGSRTTNTAIYDPATNAWTPGPPTLFAHDYGTATRMADGEVVEVGGVDASNAVSPYAEAYDPGLRVWQLVGTLATPRYNHSAVLLQDGRLLISGGYNAVPLATSEVYTPTTDATVDPSATFDDAIVGSSSTGSIGIANNGSSILLVGDLSLSGANANEFSLLDNGCAAVPAHSSCAISLRFAPGAAGLRNAALRFSANTAAGSYSVALNGRGALPSPPFVARTPKIDVKVVYLYKSTHKTTWFQKLEITGAPKGSTVTATCAKGCAKKKYVKRNTKGAVSIRTIVGRRHIKVGRSITVVVGHAGYVAAVKTIKIRKKGGPLVSTRCLPAGAKKSVSCSTL